MALELYRRKQVELNEDRDIEKILLETVSYTGYTAPNNGDAQTLFKTEKDNTSDVLIAVTNTDHTRYTFLQECDFVASCSNQTGIASTNQEITMYNSDDVIIMRAFSESDASGPESCAMVGRAQPGDYIVGRITQGGIGDFIGTNFNVQATKVTTVKLGSL